jgi:hypothetical protein
MLDLDIIEQTCDKTCTERNHVHKLKKTVAHHLVSGSDDHSKSCGVSDTGQACPACSDYNLGRRLGKSNIDTQQFVTVGGRGCQ